MTQIKAGNRERNKGKKKVNKAKKNKQTEKKTPEKFFSERVAAFSSLSDSLTSFL